MDFIQDIKKSIKAKNMTLSEFFEATGISKHTFYNWEKGSQVPLYQALKMINTLGLSADQMFGTDYYEASLFSKSNSLINDCVSSFGERLYTLRMWGGRVQFSQMSQIDFAKYLNLPSSYISDYENGLAMPSMEVLIRIAEKCNVSIDWLCGISPSHQTISTIGDFAAFCYNLKETNDIYVDFEANDHMCDYIPTESKDHYAKITFYRKDQSYPKNKEFCDVIRKIQSHFTDLETFMLSKELYDIAKEKTVEDYSRIPLRKKQIPELSHDELLNKRIEYFNSIKSFDYLFDSDEKLMLNSYMQNSTRENSTREQFLSHVTFQLGEENDSSDSTEAFEQKMIRELLSGLKEKVEHLTDNEWSALLQKIPFPVPYSADDLPSDEGDNA